MAEARPGRLATLILASALAGACAMTDSAATGRWVVPSVSPVSPSPSGSPTVSAHQIGVRVEKAALPADAFAAEKITTKQATPYQLDPKTVFPGCDKKLVADGQAAAGVWREWESRDAVIYQGVVGYLGVTAAAVLAQIRAKANACRTYREAGYTYRNRGVWTPVTTNTAVVGYGFCQTFGTTDKIGWQCYAFLAKGELVTVVMVNVAREVPTRRLANRAASVAGAHLARV